jgi:hypothetical protein
MVGTLSLCLPYKARRGLICFARKRNFMQRRVTNWHDEAGQVVRSDDGAEAEAFDREPERDICPEGLQNGLDAA